LARNKKIVFKSENVSFIYFTKRNLYEIIIRICDKLIINVTFLNKMCRARLTGNLIMSSQKMLVKIITCFLYKYHNHCSIDIRYLLRRILFYFVFSDFSMGIGYLLRNTSAIDFYGKTRKMRCWITRRFLENRNKRLPRLTLIVWTGCKKLKNENAVRSLTYQPYVIYKTIMTGPSTKTVFFLIFINFLRRFCIWKRRGPQFIYYLPNYCTLLLW
jgi:hypothetical protein